MSLQMTLLRHYKEPEDNFIWISTVIYFHHIRSSALIAVLECWWRRCLKVEAFSCCWCLMGTGWPLSSAGMVEAWVSWPSMFFISYPSDSMADCSHSSSDSLSAGQMLIVFIIGSYVKAWTYPVSLLASHLMCVFALCYPHNACFPSPSALSSSLHF